MLLLLSPAKTFNTKNQIPAPFSKEAKYYREPVFLKQANKLAAKLATLSHAELKELFGLSDKLIELNVQRYANWQEKPQPEATTPAGFTFWGNVGRNLDCFSMSDDQVSYADAHLVFLSGLYGALRPLDSMQEYRLEMGTDFGFEEGAKKCANLYAFWQDELVKYLNQRVAAEGHTAVINLASSEYYKAAAKFASQAKVPVVEIVFKEKKGDTYKVIGTLAKDARGLFSRWVVLNQIETVEGLKAFNEKGYAFAADESTATKFVFKRDN